MTPFCDVAVTAVLFYLYIYLSISTGSPLKRTAPTFPLHRPTLAFGTLGLLLICGTNECNEQELSDVYWITCLPVFP